MDEVKGYLEYDGDIYKIQSVEQLQEFMDSLEDDTDEFDDFCMIFVMRMIITMNGMIMVHLEKNMATITDIVMMS